MSTPDVAHTGRTHDGNRHGGQTAVKSSRLWWWVVAAFAVQLTAWTAWLVIASQQKIQDVPLANETAGGE